MKSRTSTELIALLAELVTALKAIVELGGNR